MLVFKKWSGKKILKNKSFILRVYLGTTYLTEIENFFTKYNIDKAKSRWNSTLDPWIITKIS